MHNGLTMAHVEAYRYAAQARTSKRAKATRTLRLPADVWEKLREAEDIERRALRMPPLAEGELKLRGPGWQGWKLTRAGK